MANKSRSLTFLCILALLPVGLATADDAAKSNTGPLEPAHAIDFQRDVRPILSSVCFQCHGPDEEHREADLRLDTREGLFGEPGLLSTDDPSASELLARVTNDDPDEKMPPPDAGQELTANQIDVLRRWVADGAPYSAHWAYVPPRPAQPDVSAELRDWVANPIDAFVAAKMREHGLSPSPPADPATLLRRVYLDLIGLPPTIEQAAAFLGDRSPRAYIDLVQQLLESQHYGEKWARHWLDAARYADSDGFEKDKPRSVWMYRDWVIRALNDDLPYDQFVIEQIAGDLLPAPTQDQLVATGFLRNSMINEEGGIDPEQFRMEAMFDRMDAVGKAILGLTLQCAQCHNHKYDPLTQTEYYGIFAFLNNSHEAAVTVYPGQDLEQRQAILTEIREIERQLKDDAPDWRKKLDQWMQTVRGNQPAWQVLKTENANDNSQRYYDQPDGSFLAQGYAPTRFDAQFTATCDLPDVRAFRLELLPDANLPAGGPGRSVDGLFALTEFWVEATAAGDDAEATRLKLVRASADYANEHQELGPAYGDQSGKRGFTGPVEYALDGKDETAWGADAGPGRRNVARQAVFVLADDAKVEQGAKLTFHLEQKHGGWNSDDNQNMNLGRFRFSATTVPDAAADPLPAAVRKIIESGREFAELSDAEGDQLFSCWRATRSEWDDANARIEALWRQHPEGTTQLVLAERQNPRPTFRLDRGDFLKTREQVTPGVPAYLHPLQTTGAPSRLDFARWLVDPRSPTTARAIVNRIWQAYFGTGIVATSEDLGSQGELPSHPELLDYLAAEFMENGWSLKWLQRQIVTSATYQQSSRVTPDQFERDPMNRWLARGPRFRLDAELVRDVALAASGLLSRQVGGPGVYPPAPEFLFLPPVSYGPKTWDFDLGADKYRRGLYTFRFRSVPYPVLTAFDAPQGDASCTRRSRSNTPLQALTTLNEPLFLECARSLAARTLSADEHDDAARIELAFRSCLTRAPSAEESQTLLEFLDASRAKFTGPDGAADATSLAALDEDNLPGVAGDASAAELAAWTAACRVIMNLDETITKE